MNPFAYPDVARVEDDGTLTAIVTKPGAAFRRRRRHDRRAARRVARHASSPDATSWRGAGRSPPGNGRSSGRSTCGGPCSWPAGASSVARMGSTNGDCRFPTAPTPAMAGCAAWRQEQSVNLVGPLGNGFALAPQTRHLLLLATTARVAALLPLVDALLDRGGKVADRRAGGGAGRRRSCAPHCRWRWNFTRPVTQQEWETAARRNDPLGRSDRRAGCPRLPCRPLADQIRARRLRLEPGFALMLVDADLACGYGACLACVVPLARGSLTRACVHGPVFDLARSWWRGMDRGSPRPPGGGCWEAAGARRLPAATSRRTSTRTKRAAPSYSSTVVTRTASPSSSTRISSGEMASHVARSGRSRRSKYSGLATRMVRVGMSSE